MEVINETIGQKKNTSNNINILNDLIKGKITDKTNISNTLNNFFTNIGPSMYAKVPRSTHSMFEVSSNVKSFQFDPITPEKVF